MTVVFINLYALYCVLLVLFAFSAKLLAINASLVFT